MILCPFHKEQGELVEGDQVSLYDDTDFNSLGTVEISRFQCRVDPSHVWEHPSEGFWLRWMAWGADWQKMRDKWRNHG